MKELLPLDTVYDSFDMRQELLDWALSKFDEGYEPAAVIHALCGVTASIVYERAENEAKAREIIQDLMMK